MSDFSMIHEQEVNIDKSPESTFNWSKNFQCDQTPSRSVETLIQMNELANEKLKISLRRLSIAESDIFNLKEKIKENEENKLQEKLDKPEGEPVNVIIQKDW